MRFVTVTQNNYNDVGQLLGLNDVDSFVLFDFRLQSEGSFIIELETTQRSVDKKKKELYSEFNTSPFRRLIDTHTFSNGPMKME